MRLLEPQLAACYIVGQTRGIEMVHEFLRTCKSKQGFLYVESDEMREVTPTIQKCIQIQREGHNIMSDISVN
jgi:hypothetical protein